MIIEYIRQNNEIYKFIVQTCQLLNIQPIIAITKSDQIPKNNNNDILSIVHSELNRFVHIDDNDKTKYTIDKSSIIFVSNITEEGYKELINKLSKIKPLINDDNNTELKGKIFVVNDFFSIPDRGQIYHGHLLNGVINIDEEVDVYCHGVVIKKKIKSIHRKSVDVERLLPGESGSITFYGKPEKNIDKTTMIIESKYNNNHITEIKCKLIFKTKDKLKQQQYTLFTGNTIINVNCSIKSDKSDKFENEDIYVLNTINNVPIIIISRFGIIKDNLNNYFFISFIL